MTQPEKKERPLTKKEQVKNKALDLISICLNAPHNQVSHRSNEFQVDTALKVLEVLR